MDFDSLRPPIMVENSPYKSKYPSVVLDKKLLLHLENTISATVLYKAVTVLEDKLRARLSKSGHIASNDDLTEPKFPDEFAHILEHAILAVVDNNLSSPGSLSTGFTTNNGFVDRDDPIYRDSDSGGPERIAIHGKEVTLNLAPTIPPNLREEYVYEIIGHISRQYEEDGNIDLETIRLEQEE